MSRELPRSADIVVRIGRRREMVDVDGDADSRAGDLTADRLGGRGMSADLVVGDANGRRPVAQARGVDAVGVGEKRKDRRLVEGHPVGDRVAKARGHEVRIVGEPANDVGIREAAAILERLRQVPVEEIQGWRDTSGGQLVDQAPIEVDALLIGRPWPVGRMRGQAMLKR